MRRTGRTIGALAALGAAGLWLRILTVNRVGFGGMTWGTVLVAAVMISLAALGGWASARGSPGWMAASALASFLPVGLYTLGGKNETFFIGAANLSLLIAAALVRDARLRGQRKKS